MMDIVGHPSGPPRLPTEPLNDEEMSALRTAMQELGWV
jgi:dihydrodipicolinate synthase/N-acetylneuraminate lyase